jgi:hypothetical protein
VDCDHKAGLPWRNPAKQPPRFERRRQAFYIKKTELTGDCVDGGAG